MSERDTKDDTAAMHFESSAKPESDDVETVPALDASTLAIERRITRLVVEQRSLYNSATSRKVDFRLLPILCGLYTISLIDRSNLGSARIAGINQDIGLSIGNRYSVVVLVFYVGYILVELPSNILLKWLGAANWLSFLSLSFGLLSVGTGLIHSYGALVVLRILLGCMEAGLFPGIIYLISAWYRRFEVQKRIAVFFSLASFLSSFANILAYGLTQIADEPEKHGWRWIFIIEGCITCGLAILAWFVIVDFPESPRNKGFLTAEEHEVLRQRLVQERGHVEAGKVTAKLVLSVVCEWRHWAIGFVYCGGSGGIYSFLFFLPTILRDSMGYSQVAAFCLTTPPAAVAIIYSIAVSYLADRMRIRGPYAVLGSVVAVVGLAMTAFVAAPGPRYAGTFLGYAGSTSVISTSLAWGQNNVRSDNRRNVVTVIQIVSAAIGGIYSALVFRQQDAPNYVPGVIAMGLLILVGGIVSLVSSIVFFFQNKRADRGEVVLEESPDFRYTW
ncbi:Major Facilitator Superfamily protein [Sporothrix schenckii 1099-18]|uniref:Major Facilitator Superfamily protein n=1 Tax=Sporothrix schenckii 1099-18 TaxID=1397361 RepID=A0A0F2MDQ0_SPOSC|nr:Major Facilitator Superfamily protein [Sporothrix schenckii 1099-18]KJR87772.1 Major Facilitator Superfamily protein [Sporothrix schenckii 1099-18]